MISSQEKDVRNRRIMREAKRKEAIKVKVRKEEENLERDKWIEMQFKDMTKKIKKDSYTIKDFKSLLKQVSSPFKHCSSDGHTTMINPREAMCINKMAMNIIDGVLQQKRQAEEIAGLNALEKARKAKKHKRTPNTMRGDDGIGITMGLQDHDQQTNAENSVALVQRLQKSAEKLERTLQSYAEIEQKHKGQIEFERCTGKELNILMSIVFPKSGETFYQAQ